MTELELDLFRIMSEYEVDFDEAETIQQFFLREFDEYVPLDNEVNYKFIDENDEYLLGQPE